MISGLRTPVQIQTIRCFWSIKSFISAQVLTLDNLKKLVYTLFHPSHTNTRNLRTGSLRYRRKAEENFIGNQMSQVHNTWDIFGTFSTKK